MLILPYFFKVVVSVYTPSYCSVVLKNEALNFIAYTKCNSKWIKDLNIRLKIIKTLKKKNIGGKLHDLTFDKDFLDMIPKEQATKVKINKLEYIR